MHVDTFIHRRSEFVTRNIIFGHFVLLCKAELSGGVFLHSEYARAGVKHASVLQSVLVLGLFWKILRL